MNGSLVLSSSPPESGMLIHGAPVKVLFINFHHLKCIYFKVCNKISFAQQSQNIDYCCDTSQIIPNISPIYSTMNMSRESLRSRSRSVARLDFTNDMSIDESLQRRGYSSSHSLGIYFSLLINILKFVTFIIYNYIHYNYIYYIFQTNLLIRLSSKWHKTKQITC